MSDWIAPASHASGLGIVEEPLACFMTPAQPAVDSESWVIELDALATIDDTGASSDLSSAEVADILRQIAPHVPTAIQLRGLRIVVSEFGLHGRWRPGRTANTIVFTGRPGRRRLFTAVRYGLAHPKIVSVGLDQVVRGATFRSVGRAVRLTAVVVGSVDLTLAVLDVMTSDGGAAPVIDASVTVASESVKTAVASTIGAAVGQAAIRVAGGIVVRAGLVAAAAVVTGVAASAGAIIIVSVAVGFGLSWLDRKFQITARMQTAARDAWQDLKQWHDETSRGIAYEIDQGFRQYLRYYRMSLPTR